MKCPHCQETLHMTHRDGIEIDYCPECRGVWLDRGELDKIIERSESWGGSAGGAPGPSRDPAPEYRERRDDRDRDHGRDDRDYGRDDRGGGKKKKRSSFVGDLFENFGDFGP